jgi:hypothetical protein
MSKITEPALTARHRHDWELVWERAVGGFQVADAHQCRTCPATKWSAQDGYRDEAIAAAARAIPEATS